MVEIKNITAENIDSLIQSTPEIPIVIIFQVVWSTACHLLMNNVEIAVEQVENLAVWGIVDLDIEHSLAERFSIITMPTILVIQKGEIVKQYFGVQDSTSLVDMIKELNDKEVVTKPGV